MVDGGIYGLGWGLGDNVALVYPKQGFLWDMTEEPECKNKGRVGIGVVEDLPPHDVLRRAIDSNVPQIVQKNTFHPEVELDSSVLLYHKASILFDKPLATILAPSLVNEEQEERLTLLDFSISKSSQKSTTLEALESKITPLCKSTVVTDILLVADEILSNAIYNAPFVDAENTSLGASRTEGPVEFSKPARFKVGHDGERLVLTCLDHYGALNIEKLLHRIVSCYVNGAAASIDSSGKGGARIGSYLIFESCLSYYVAVEPGKRTLVAATFPMNLNRKKRELLTKNLHIFRVE